MNRFKSSARPPSFPDLIPYDSTELVCLHEAGHAVVALHAKARVVEMELMLDPPPARGRTRIETTDNAQRQIIALGGFAVERRIWDAGCLVDTDGQPLAERKMLDRAANNASEDRIMYFGKDHSEGGLWPAELDLQFMLEARNLGQAVNMGMVKHLGEALHAKKLIEEPEIMAIWHTY